MKYFLICIFIIGCIVGSLREKPTSNVSVGTITQYTLNERKEYNCMLWNLMHEARGEGTEGMQAVAAVVANRVLSSKYPNTICGVILQKNQFSWTQDRAKVQHMINASASSSKRSTMRYTGEDYLAYQRAVSIASRGVTELSTAVPRGVMHYAHKNVQNQWTRSMKVSQTVKNHVFYRM